MKELILKECKKCHALVKVLEECNCQDCGIICCNEAMTNVVPNTTDASFEKHIPTYEVKDNQMIVTVNHVMEEEHYIEWILVKTVKQNIEILLEPAESPTITVPYEKGALLYAYCNKHGLWKKEVE